MLNIRRSEGMEFTKMQGCGNDYIYFNCMEQELSEPGPLSVRLSDRHFGIGGDGIVLICRSDIADAKMRMFNADGSEGKMCGNAIRCVGKYLSDNGLVGDKNELDIETLSGVKHLVLHKQRSGVRSVTVDMGPAQMHPSSLPVLIEGTQVVNSPVKIGGTSYNITCVSMGNPHCVVLCDDVEGLEIEKIGPQFENSELFPERVNTEFIKLTGKNTLRMRVWERGSGETWACGTGACAAAVAAVENGLCAKGEDIIVRLNGGNLLIKYTDKTVTMTGTADKVFDGTIKL
ncbi:diaminopimelate epimerase [[Clostridium] methylpentosum DSM 5476]|uniref:Diaminopimelate epimerase n=1 Tax=[Clostridium] methylpentosum DSM 5476 TaxID=537013 RepID=C0EAG3_9FIRM|nr:diaminopimelate epimerase [[Clostridium] methylpentosum DSM 5476]